MRIQDHIQSAEQVWLLWLTGVTIVGALLVKLIARQGFAGWNQLLVEEEGAAYTLSYVMIMPVYVMLIALVIHMTQFLLVKIGTIEAAYAAARSHAVWGSFDSMSPGSAKKKSEQAAVLVMSGYASSSSLHSRGTNGTPGSAQGELYYQSYQAYTQGHGSVGRTYLVNKYRYAARATKVTFADSTSLDGDTTATVTYEMPIQFPIFGRLFGHRAPWAGAHFFTLTVVSQATLPNEVPRNNDRNLGIEYVPR